MIVWKSNKFKYKKKNKNENMCMNQLEKKKEIKNMKQGENTYLKYVCINIFDDVR